MCNKKDSNSLKWFRGNKTKWEEQLKQTSKDKVL